MKVAAFLMLIALSIPIRSSAQDLHGTFALAAEAGYLTNTYLHPVLPIWIAADAPFVGLEPSARFAWMGTKTYAAIDGRLRLIERMDPEELWSMATSQARLDHRLHRNVAVGVDGSVSRIRFGTNQWLVWGGPYVRTRLGSNVNFTVRGGASYRSYDGTENAATFDQTNTFAVAQMDVSAAGPWTVSGHAFASRPVSDEGTAAGGGGSIHYYITSRLSLSVEAGAERFGPDASTRRSAASVTWDARDAVSWSARFGLQQFVNGSGASPDVFASIGISYRWTRHKDLSPPPPIVWTQQGGELILRYAYDGDGELYLVGDFNDWTVGEIALRNVSEDVYSARLSLPPGRYEYKIMLVEGGVQRWLPLPDDVLTTDDDFGDTNGILLVEDY